MKKNYFDICSSGSSQRRTRWEGLPSAFSHRHLNSHDHEAPGPTAHQSRRKVAGGILGSRDEAVDLRDRLQRELDTQELVSWPTFLITSNKHHSLN